jgi:NitT/TauT family transport system substrate-binding protein
MTTNTFGTPLRRRTFTSLAALTAAAVAVPSLRAQGKLEKTKVSIAVGGKAAFYYLPLTLAEQLGYFKSEGLDVEISDFAGGSRALQAVVGGSADVVSGAYEHTINLQSKAQMFQAFVLQGRAPQIAMGVSTKAMPTYKTVADLRGKKIGVSAPARPPTWWPTWCCRARA